ncbi:hypothetical protein [Litchfieldia alkalitelluris]|uniref:hypothetical protein n=1 Tax=Litchfieldia alkalitelluris TaxID=304268 RepID=UPI0009986AE4|nr:hypothetical protein [Litchfieldia alkalitelluris]
MQYYSVREIENIHNMNTILNYARTLWYSLAEGYEIIPNSYTDFCFAITQYEKVFFEDWSLTFNGNGSLMLTKNIPSGDILVKIDSFGKEIFIILPNMK